MPDSSSRPCPVDGCGLKFVGIRPQAYLMDHIYVQSSSCLQHREVFNGSRCTRTLQSFHCKLCGKKFPLKGTLRRHMRETCTAETIPCSCGKQLKNLRTQKKHIEEGWCKPERAPKISCMKCGKSYKTSRTLSDHITRGRCRPPPSESAMTTPDAPPLPPPPPSRPSPESPETAFGPWRYDSIFPISPEPPFGPWPYDDVCGGKE